MRLHPPVPARFEAYSSVFTVNMRAGRRLDEASLAQVAQRLLDLFPRVHNERTVARNRFVQWFAGDQQEARGAFVGGDLNEVALAPDHQLRRPNENLFRITIGKLRLALEEVGERCVTSRDAVSELTARRDGDVHIR